MIRCEGERLFFSSLSCAFIWTLLYRNFATCEVANALGAPTLSRLARESVTASAARMAAEPEGAPPPRKRGGVVENKSFDFNNWREGQRTDKASMRPDAKPLAPVTRILVPLGKSLVKVI